MNREYETARVEDRGEGLLLLTLNRAGCRQRDEHPDGARSPGVFR